MLMVRVMWGAAAGANVNGDTFLPDISSYDYDTLISEAGATGQPGTGGPNKYMVRVSQVLLRGGGGRKGGWIELRLDLCV